MPRLLPRHRRTHVEPAADPFEAVARALSLIIDLRDAATGEHCRMVGELSGETAIVMGTSTQDHRQITVAGRLHDLGKVSIPDRVLHNTDNLDERELNLVRAHSEHGEEILSHLSVISDDLASAAILVGAHHERWDGHGYPRGRAGSDIPLGARILSVADAYSALVMRRSYQAATSHQEAMEIIVAGAGRYFDPSVVEAFAALDWAGRLYPQG